jgi:hypothetical protein
MYEFITAAAAREHIRDLRASADRDRRLALARYRIRRRDRGGRDA